MITKDDVYKGFQSIGNFITTIGNTIKENERKKKVQKVLSEFNNPDKIFLNADGTPKTDAEIAPILNQGVMSLYQLGEDKLANSLTEYFGTMSKSFDKTSQNAFNYDYKRDSKFFPKGQDGQPIPFKDRVDYSGVRDEKEFAPQNTGTWKLTDIQRPDGSFETYYYNNKTGKYKTQDENGVWWEGTDPIPFKSGKVDPTRYTKSNNYTTVNTVGQEMKDQYTDNKGNLRTVMFKDGVPYDAGTQERITDMTNWNPVTDYNQNKNAALLNITDAIMGQFDTSNMEKSEIDKYRKYYDYEIQSYINGGTLPSFVTMEWLQNNQGIWNDILKLKNQVRK